MITVFSIVISVLILCMKFGVYLLIILAKAILAVFTLLAKLLITLIKPSKASIERRKEYIEDFKHRRYEEPEEVKNDEDLAAMSQIEAWKNQMLANFDYIRELEKQIENVKKSTATVDGSYDYLEVAKLKKKIATAEVQNASVEMRLRKCAEKYNLQDLLEFLSEECYN